MPDETLEDLFRKVQGRADEEAFARIYARTEKIFFHRAVAFLRSRHLAEQALQDAYLKMYRYRASFIDGRRFLPWAYTILDKVSYDVRQRSRRGREISIEAIREPPDPRGSFREEREEIDEALSRLPHRQATALRLRAEMGYSYREIAARMGCTTSAVAELLYRARARLRVVLKGVRIR
jgi:RNA polymerase sigma-70 factor (ECF subfamily)